MKGQAPRRTRGQFKERQVKVNKEYVATYIRHMHVWGDGPILVAKGLEEAEKGYLNAPSILGSIEGSQHWTRQSP